MVVLGDGEPLVWLDRRGHHLVTFPMAAEDDRWADALAMLVKDGRARAVEVRKVNGTTDVPAFVSGPLVRSGFVSGYRGLLLRS